MKRFVLLLLLIPVSTWAQAWSGILDPTRAIDWTQAGVIGGIPSASWTQCGATINPYGNVGHESGDNGSGTVSVTNGNPTVTVTAGSTPQSWWVNERIVIGGNTVYTIQSVSGQNITLTTNVTNATGNQAFRGGGGLSPATINTAIQACGANQYVLLGPGTFNLDGGIQMKSNVVLRGSGADSTFLSVYLSIFSCGATTSWMCFSTTQTGFGTTGTNPGGTQAASWTGGYSQGATSITVASVGSTGIHNGQYIYLDQQNDFSDPGTLFVCGTLTVFPSCSIEGEAGAGRNSPAGTYHSQLQVVQVTAGCASACTGAGPFTLTITPGLYGIRWASGNTPGAWWSTATVTNAGAENFSIDTLSLNPQNVTGTVTFQFANSANCWVSGVRSINGNLAHIWMGVATHITAQNNYLYGTVNSASQSYGVETFGASDNLIVNNIFQHVSNPWILGPVMGNVYAYNFSINNFINLPTFLSPQANEHDAGVLYNLMEGNIGAEFYADVFHGTSGANTFFRNRWNGNECTSGTCTGGGQWPVQLRALNRVENVVANVLGTTSVHTTNYVTNAGAVAIYYLNAGGEEGCNIKNTAGAVSEVGNDVTVNCSNAVTGGINSFLTIAGVSVPAYNGNYQITSGGNGSTQFHYTNPTSGLASAQGGTAHTVVPTDSLVTTTLLRWGNWDTVTAATRWCGNSSDTGWSTTCASTSEVPTGLATYANAVPTKGDTGAGQNDFPASFYYSATPSWWPSGKPFPPIGPDVNSGNMGVCSGGSYLKNNVTSATSTLCSTGGGTFVANDVGGHANSNPAMDCFLGPMSGPPDGSGAALTFNANTCYATVAVTPPAPLNPVMVGSAACSTCPSPAANKTQFCVCTEGAMLSVKGAKYMPVLLYDGTGAVQ